MGVRVTFTSGKSRTFKNATQFYDNPNEYFRGQGGRGYTAPAVVIAGFPSGKTVHYKKSKVRSVNYT